MDGVFLMKKVIMRISACFMIVVFVWFGTVLSDRKRLNEELIRIHVVADSESSADQNIKLAVRDVVIKSLTTDMKNISDVEAAKCYLQEKLPQIQKAAAQTLEKLECPDSVSVSFQKNAFEKSATDQYTFPAGIYESLQIIIGSGEGKNWWGVMFPDVCSFLSETDSAAAPVSGFPISLESCLHNDAHYSPRFYLLDMFGRLENIFFKG